MNDKWIEYAIRIQSIAQAGLKYGRDKFDLERYEELRNIPKNLAAEKTTKEQILMCFDSYEKPNTPTFFD